MLTSHKPSAGHDWHSPPCGDKAAASWFPVDLHVPRRELGFLNLSNHLVAESTFLDSRIAAPWQNPVWQSAASFPLNLQQIFSTHFLFHTSFCCSTLLSRALQFESTVVGLREPLILRRLADAQFANYPADGMLEVCLQLLSRPWRSDGSVLIKPTHVALPLATSMLATLCHAKGVLLTSSLEAFLLSNIKKNAESHAKIPDLVRRMSTAAGVPELGDLGRLQKTPFLHLVALQWATQQMLLSTIVTEVGKERVRLVVEDALLSDFESHVLKIVDWLKLPVSSEEVMANARNVAGKHAKQTEAAYDAKRKREEADYLRRLYGRDILGALRWAEQALGSLLQAPLHQLANPQLSLANAL